MAHTGHNHGDSTQINQKKLLLSIVLNLIITLAEIIGGIISNSLALISDALHNFSDTLALVIAYIANRVSKRESTEMRTFGFKRIEILSAFFNSLVLIGISLFLFLEAFERFLDPKPVNGLIMMIVAIIGLLGNLFSIILLHGDRSKNLNIKAAYLHLLGDTLSSVAVVGGGILIYFYNLHWIDPLITIIIGLYIIREAWSILIETIEILMQGTPKELSLEKLKERIVNIPDIQDIHHLHAWRLNDKNIHFECHVDLGSDIPVSKTQKIGEEVEKILHDEFKIEHVTLQFEYHECKKEDECF
ncbi:MAG: cation transporter [Bacteroidales bacterium]|nr:cation transporter [Bacteroidales bacterium]